MSSEKTYRVSVRVYFDMTVNAEDPEAAERIVSDRYLEELRGHCKHAYTIQTEGEEAGS